MRASRGGSPRPVTTLTVSGVPAAYVPLFVKAGKTCPEVSAALLAAQAKIESVNFNADVISGKRHSPVGAMGVSQFMAATWKAWGKGSPYEPANAIAAQAKFMCELVRVLGSTDAAICGYNAGPNAVKRYGGCPPFKETTNYIKRIKGEMK